MRRLQRIADFAIPWGVGVFLVLVAGEELGGDGPHLVPYALAAVQGVALRWRRRSPVRATAVVLAGATAYQLLVPEIVIPIAPLFAVGALAANRPPRISLPGLAALLALAASNFLTTTVDDAVFTLALAVGAWALGEAARNRRVAIDEGARRAVGEEQARIARELHDVIAHSVSVIVVQAAAADDVFDERPDQARAALRSIESAGRDALVELRRLITAVRPGAERDDTAPQPGLDRLEELAAPLRGGGLEVVVRRDGAPDEVPAGVDLSAYRIVQEALTNTLRHAAATRRLAGRGGARRAAGGRGRHRRAGARRARRQRRGRPADRRPRRRARPAPARADPPPRQPGGGVHGADLRQRRLPARGGHPMIPFSATVRSEWTKLRSLRSTTVMLVLAVVLAVVMTALLAVVAGATYDDWKAAERAEWEPISAAMFGGLFSAIVFAVLGVRAATSEYGGGTIRVTFAATPRRGRVLAAKAVVVAAAVVAVSTLATLAMFLTGQAIYGSYGLESASLAEGDALRTVIAESVMTPILPLVGLALGFVLRSTAGAVTSVLGLVFAPWIFGGLLPEWWQDHVLDLLPAAAASAISMGHLPGGRGRPRPGARRTRARGLGRAVPGRGRAGPAPARRLSVAPAPQTVSGAPSANGRSGTGPRRPASSPTRPRGSGPCDGGPGC